jgi:PAS domain S-box-containing protein
MKNPALLRNFIVFAVIMLICIGGLLYHTLRSAEDIKQSGLWVGQTQKVILQTQELITSIITSLSMQRNYILTREENSLIEYDKAKADISTRIATLRDLVKDNPAQASRFNEIEHLSLKLKDALDAKTVQFKDVFEIPNIADYDDVVKIRDDIFRLTTEVMRAEYVVLETREQEAQKLIERYQKSLLIGGLLASLIFLLFNWYLLQAQSKVSAFEASLKESEERLRLAIRGSNDGIFDWNFKTNQIFWSSQYKEMLGYTDDEIQGDEETFRKLLDPEDSEAYWENFNNYINGNLSEFSCVFRMTHKSGRTIWINGRGKALFDENRRPVRFIGAHTDISYIKEHERQLKEERDRAEAANLAKGEFLAHMSHEIRTPLTAVSGIAEILNNAELNVEDKHKRLLKTLRTSTETLKELITDILDFSKIESGEVELHNQKFMLGDLFEQVVSIMSVKANEKMIDFTVDYEDVKSTVYFGDRLRLRQILINLIGNAVKFTEKGFVRVKAQIEPVADSHILKIEIQDSGIGISPHALPIIFEKFRQADSSVSRRYGGTGLGLPISKSLAEIMGGVIKVTSEVDKGSTFSLILPFTSLQNDSTVDMNEAVRIHKLNDRLRAVIGDKKKILLAEDYEGNIVVLSYILSALNVAYDVARTGLEAVQAWKKRHYDIILMDVQMPEMDGLTATNTIRNMEQEQNIERTPIIGLTAHALVADQQKCIEAGMDAYLSKPIVEADLKATILQLLEKRPDKNQAA